MQLELFSEKEIFFTHHSTCFNFVHQQTHELPGVMPEWLYFSNLKLDTISAKVGSN